MRDWGLPRGGIAAADLLPLTYAAIACVLRLARAVGCAITAAVGAIVCMRRSRQRTLFLDHGMRRAMGLAR